MWYAKDGKGYTAYVQNAERFTAEKMVEAIDMCKGKYEVYKCREVDRRLQLVFDNQDKKRLKQNPSGNKNPWGENCKYAVYNGENAEAGK